MTRTHREPMWASTTMNTYRIDAITLDEEGYTTVDLSVDGENAGVMTNHPFFDNGELNHFNPDCGEWVVGQEIQA